jgi:predicted O-methyltransferase YrrM
MIIMRLIKQNPLAAQVYKTFISLVHGRANRKILEQLKNTPYPQGAQIAEALESLQRKLPQPDQKWIERIEVERKRLLSRKEPLNDGSLGVGGLYDNDVTIQQACLVSKPPLPALQLFLLTRTVKPSHVIELGTNVGISSAYIGAALKLNGQNGKIITLDASPYRQRLAKEVHCNLGIDNISYGEGLFTDTLNPSLIQLGSIDLAFIDGHHQYQPTLDYFEEILEFSTPSAAFVFDDIRWSDGMKKAWSQIQSDDRLGMIVDLSSVGVCTRSQQEVPQRLVFGPIKAF